MLTTYALTGSLAWLPIASANWLVSPWPTTLNEGGADGVGGIAEPPPTDAPAGGVGSGVDVIVFTFAIPPAITAAAPIKPNIPPCANALFAPA